MKPSNIDKSVTSPSESQKKELGTCLEDARIGELNIPLSEDQKKHLHNHIAEIHADKVIVFDKVDRADLFHEPKRLADDLYIASRVFDKLVIIDIIATNELDCIDFDDIVTERNNKLKAHDELRKSRNIHGPDLVNAKTALIESVSEYRTWGTKA